MRNIAIAVFPGVQALDVAGPVDVFGEANQFVGEAEGYRVVLVAAETGAVPTSNRMSLLADAAFDQNCASFHTALVAGGPTLPESPPNVLAAWIDRASSRCVRYGSICTGAFVLGHAGLLDGKNVTTHWENAPRLAERFPRARVMLDSIYVRDGAMVTSAGITAGIDMALALVAEDHGSAVALAVAKRLVVFAHRRGGQSQFSPYLNAPTKVDDPATIVQSYVMEHVHERFTVAKLADVAGMSHRNFARVFSQSAGVTPHEFVERARLDAARRLLEDSAAPLKVVAYECGFGTADRLRIVFRKRLGISPNDYRSSFRKT